MFGVLAVCPQARQICSRDRMGAKNPVRVHLRASAPKPVPCLPCFTVKTSSVFWLHSCLHLDSAAPTRRPHAQNSVWGEFFACEGARGLSPPLQETFLGWGGQGTPPTHTQARLHTSLGAHVASRKNYGSKIATFTPFFRIFAVCTYASEPLTSIAKASVTRHSTTCPFSMSRIRRFLQLRQ